MASRERQYIRTLRAIEDLLLECIAQPTVENVKRLRQLDELFPELERLRIRYIANLTEPVPSDLCLVLVESFGDIRDTVPEAIAVYGASSEELQEGRVGLRDIYYSRLAEI